jgi:hypothetical protein
MDTLENRFVLKPLIRATDDDYTAALRIYSNETPLEIRTNTNEFSYWLNKKDDKAPFDLLMFCLSLDGNIIGFAELCYIKSQKVIILDYISLKDPYRLNAVFLVFFSMLQNYISNAGIDVSFFVAEISNKNGGKDIDRESTFYKKIVCLEGFGQVDCKYYNLPLGLSNHESSFESFMFIKTVDIVKSIARETFLGIVFAICYEYYLVWYGEFLTPNEIEEYKLKLNVSYKSIEKQCTSNDSVNIVYPACPLFANDQSQKTSGIIPVKKITKATKLPLIILLVFFCPIVLVGLYSYLLPAINVQFSATSTFIGTVIASIVSSASAFYIAKKKNG